MANTYTQIYIRVVFAVKGRQHFINESCRERLQQFITGIIAKKGQKTMAIYCMPDHTRVFISMSPEPSISCLVRDIKSNSTTFLKHEKLVTPPFSWQSGFGAFSYAKSQADTVINYVLNQKQHYSKKTFKQEYLEFLEKFDIEYDEKYLFEFYN